MSLASGGHLTHGYKLSSSGLLYDFHSYITKDGKIDYNDLGDKLKTIKQEFTKNTNLSTS